MRKFKTCLALFVCLFLFFTTSIYSQQTEKYSKVKVFANTVQFNSLLTKGIALDELAEKTTTSFTGVFSATELRLIKESNLKTEIVVDDLATDFVKRNEKAKAAMLAQSDNLRTGGTPPGFNYGSMGGYLTYSEMVAELDEMKTMYPNLITVKTNLGNSVEGRAVWMVKISDNPDVEEVQEEGVLYTGLIHAREPISMMNLIYFMQYILSQYNTDPEIACLINNRELYFIPCANPDGYVYNQTTNPSGGGLWRKNRKNNGDGTFGVDLNRNFGYQWGFDNNGSSPTTSSETYRGTGAFSEIETQNYQNFANTYSVNNALNHHSYSNKLILPFSYNNSASFNETHYNNLASLLTLENKYPYGRAFPMLGYNANGNSDDWFHGSNNIYAFTPETGHPADDFWPVQSKIISICDQNLDMNIYAAWSAGKYIKPRIAANTTVSGFSYNLPIIITNYGNAAGTIETVTLSLTDSRIQSYDNSPVSLLGLGVDNTITVSKNIIFNSNATNGTINGNLITTNTEGCVYNIPISFQYSPNGCFSIPPSWTGVDIGATGLAGSSCYLNGLYTIKGAGTGLTTASDKAHMMKLTTAADVMDITARVVTAQNTTSGARSGISIAENSNVGSKRVTLLINPATGNLEFQKRTATNGSISTMTISGQGVAPKWLRIVKGTGGNYTGYYSSNGTSWTQIGKQKVTFPTNVIAGLVVTSGSNTILHTSTFDNLAVTTPGGVINRTNSNAVNNQDVTNAATEFSIYPNPSKGYLELRLPVSSEKQSIKIYDFNGKQVYGESSIQNSKTLDLTRLANGLYFIQYAEGTKVSYRKFVMTK